MIRVVRIGDAKGRGEGVRLGTVRLLPRGIRKEEYAARNLFEQVIVSEKTRQRGWFSGSHDQKALQRAVRTQPHWHIRRKLAPAFRTVLQRVSHRS